MSLCSKAVCCTDHVHCCPSGWTCDLAQQACVQASDSIPISQMITEPAQTESPEEDEEDEEDDEEEEEYDGEIPQPELEPRSRRCLVGDAGVCVIPAENSSEEEDEDDGQQDMGGEDSDSDGPVLYKDEDSDEDEEDEPPPS